MSRITAIFIIIFLQLSVFSTKSLAEDYIPEPYSWTSMSENSSGSMPCGGHDIGLNIWAESGSIYFYACQSGWFDENNMLLKAGRFRIDFSNPLQNSGFQQTLDLYNGYVTIKDAKHEVRLWVDTFSPIIYIELLQTNGDDINFSYETWRHKDRLVTKDECQQNSWKWDIPKNCTTFADSIIADKHSLIFFHQNRAETVFDYTVKKEGLDSVKTLLYNPIGERRMEGRIIAPNFNFSGISYGTYASTDYKAYTFTQKKARKCIVSVPLFTNFRASFQMPETQRDIKAVKKSSENWWHDYWQRSWIKTSSPEMKETVRNYELFRFMLGCNAFGEWPTKFNGGLFTFDPVYEDASRPFTPDYRCWGGGTMTAQNQRLVYWPLLKSGDFDLLLSQLSTYLRMLPNATLRTKCYWGHEGASFCEQIENCGLPNPAEYGKHKPSEDMGNERNAWLEYQWDTALEFCQMAIDLEKFSGQKHPEYYPLIENCLTFFDKHYRYLAKQRGVKDTDENGKLILYPSSGCETFKMAYNPSSVIAALKTVSLNYFWQSGDSAFYKLYQSIPELPIKDGMIQPAIVWARVQNVETTQLYPVYPWRMFGAWQANKTAAAKDSLEIARNTYLYDSHAIKMRSTEGWKQDNIWAACLGLTEEATKLNKEKFAKGPYRFPVFWQKGFDWSPDHNRGGAAMIGLQEMLLQESPDGDILICPSWPKNCNVEFKLHSSKGVIYGKQ